MIDTAVATITVADPGAALTELDSGDGTFTYTPDAGFTGTDSFSYTVTDGHVYDFDFDFNDNGVVDSNDASAPRSGSKTHSPFPRSLFSVSGSVPSLMG